MKKVAVIFTIVMLLLALTACSNVEDTTNQTNSETQKEQLTTYYDRDNTINLFLNRFNTYNPNQVITSDLFHVYYHHGKEHDNQIIFNRDDFEIVITSTSYSDSIKIVIDGSRNKTVDDYKILFSQYVKVFNPKLTDADLETYWQSVLDDIIHSVKFDEFDCSLTNYSDNKTDYMIIEGKIS